ncbi:MAG: glucose-6-phosphate isomerase [Gaiellaceae bacterium]
MTPVDVAELVDRIWARDPTVWTGTDEASWLGWLDEPGRMIERLGELDSLERDFDDIVLLGMGGSSLAPEVLRRTFAVERFHVLDTTHPAAIRALEAELDAERTLFVAASKSGTTLETRCQLDYFLDRGGTFAAITDPGTELEQLARERDFAWVVAGEPTVGGRYSALSPFGMVPAALMDLDLRTLLERATAMAEWCRLADDNPGAELGVQLGDGWTEGREKVCFEDTPGGIALWIEQLLAESTGKEGKGLVPAPGESPEGPDRHAARVRLDDPYDIGAEFFRWEFATAVAGSMLGINPFNQPDVQAAKDRTTAIIERGDFELEPESSVEELLAQAGEGDYVAILAFVDPARAGELEPLVERARRETGCVVTEGLGPRYLHSTGQLHKGGPNSVLALQVVDDLGQELKIPRRKFGFRRLIAAQAAGDLEALKERGRRVARVRLDDV